MSRSKSRGRAQTSSSKPLPVMKMTASVHELIRRTIGTDPAETGGILGGGLDDRVVRHFEFDRHADTSEGTYSPDCDFLNRLLENDWNPRHIRMLGFVHSHPGLLSRPSHGDLVYAARILEVNPSLSQLLLPIVTSQDGGGRFDVRPFRAVRVGNKVGLEEMRLELLQELPATADATPGRAQPNAGQAAASEHAPPSPAVEAVFSLPAPALPERQAEHLAATGPGSAVSESEHRPSPRQGTGAVDQPVSTPVDTPLGPPRVTFAAPAPAASLAGTFARVATAYDLPRLAASRVILVGIGGARQFVENLARAGVGEYVLIDHDIVGESNIATQHVRRREIGRSKVQCLKERIVDINPAAVVRVRECRLEDIDDDAFALLASEPLRKWEVTASSLWNVPGLDVPVDVCLRPAVTLLGGFTDNFPAQARVNRLGLKFGLPTLCGQIYQQGIGAEITFTYPGITPACHRCALRMRYEAILEQGYQDEVTSDGAPIFATERLNALKGFIAMALLHHGTNHPHWGGLLQRIGARNLIQIRMDPDAKLPVFERVLGGADQQRILFDETVWLPQQADHPETNGLSACPDCGGSGDLRDCQGRIEDTRVMPTEAV